MTPSKVRQVVGSAFTLLAEVVADGRADNVVEMDASLQVALRQVLFPLLERLGDASLSLSAASELTLYRICAAVGDRSVPHVLCFPCASRRCGW